MSCNADSSAKEREMNMNLLRSALVPAVVSVGLVLLLGTNPVSANDRHHYRASDHPRGHAYGHFKKKHRHGHPRGHAHGYFKKHHRHVRHEYRGHEYYLPPERIVYRQPNYGRGYAAQSPNFGNAVGGALGGYIGSQIGKGSGRLAATAAGAVAGYVLGGHVGNGYY
jgi:hypothetical protein